MRAREWQRETSDGSAWSSWASPVAEKFSASGWQWPTASYSGPTTSRVVEQPVSARFLRASLHAAHGSPLRHPSPSMGPTAAIVPSSSLGPPLPGPVEGRPSIAVLNARCELENGRDRVELHGPNTESPGRGGNIRSEPEDGRDGQMQSKAIKLAICTSQTCKEPNDTLPLIRHLVLVLPWPGEELKCLSRHERAQLRGPSPILSLILHLVLALPWPGEERATPLSRFGGGVEMPASPRAS